MLPAFIGSMVKYLSVFLGFGLLSAVATIGVSYINYRQQERFRKEDDKHERQFNTVFGNEKPGLINAEANLLRIEQLNLQSVDVEYGECGVGVFWKYDKQSKVLEIHGYGPMVPGMGYEKAFDNDDKESYFKFSKLTHDVKKVIINEGITKLEVDTFCGYDALEEVYIGPNIKRIPFCCFMDCINLKHVYLPYNLEEIGAEAFKNCKSLMDVSFPRTLKRIERHAFYGCSSFHRFYYPYYRLQKIDLCAFSNSGLRSIEIGGVEEIRDLAFSDTKELKSVTIDYFGTIEDSVFGNSAVTEIKLRSGHFISADAFNGCNCLMKVEFVKNEMDSNHSISDVAFKYPMGLIELQKNNEKLFALPPHYKGFQIIRMINVMLYEIISHFYNKGSERI